LNQFIFNNSDNLPRLMPWQKITLTGIFNPKDNYRRYMYQGNLTINGNSYNYKLPVISTLALLFYFIVIIGLTFFTYILYRLRKPKPKLVSKYPSIEVS
jgi:hypothetical protein